MKVIYIDINDCSGKYPNSLDDGDAFYTHGWGALLAKEFKKYNEEFEVECWKADNRIKYQQQKTIVGVQFKIYPAIHIKKLGYFSIQMANAIKKLKDKGTIINISSGRHLLFFQIALLCKSIPLVVQHHGETTSIFDFKFRQGVLSKSRALLTMIPEQAAFKNVNHYFILDERLIEFLPRTFKGTYSVQTTGVDPEIFYPMDKLEARRELGLPSDKKYILYIGRIGDHKRFDILLEIYRELKQERKNVQLIVAGNRPGDKFEMEAIEVGVIIFGVIKQTELYKYLSVADVYVLPGLKSIHTFGGVGMLPLQAALCNIPVVGASLGAVKQEIRDKIGIYAEGKTMIKKSIENVLDEIFKPEALRETVLKEYSWENITNSTKTLYDRVLGE